MTAFNTGRGSFKAASSGGGTPGLPTWRQGRTVGVLAPVSGTAMSVSDLNQFSGWAMRSATTELASLCSGGHDTTPNAVYVIDFRANSPTWVLKTPSSSAVIVQAAYYADGKPATRHNYNHNFWCEYLGRYMMFGAHSVYGGGPQEFPFVDGWNPLTATWDPPKTYVGDGSPDSYGRVSDYVMGSHLYPDCPLGYGAVQDGLGRVFTNGIYAYNQETNSWSAPVFSGITPAGRVGALDTVRNVIFMIQWGDNFNSGSGLQASKWNMNHAGTSGDPYVASTITWSAGSASVVAQFAADAPSYAQVVYDEAQDRHLFWDGNSDRIYVVTPNSGTVWDMTTIAAPPPRSGSAGINKKMDYMPAMKGVYMQPDATQNGYFLPTGIL